MTFNLEQLKDQEGNVYAVAAVPEGYIAGSALRNQVQHDRVPFSVSAHVLNPQKGIFVFGLTDEMFTTYVNQFIKQTLKMVPNIIWSSVRDFVEPEAYLNLFAMAMTQMELSPVATGALPSMYNSNLDRVRSMLLDEYNMYMAYDLQAGTPTHLNHVACCSYLKKYTAVKDGVPQIVFAGMDYKGVEEYTDASPAAFVGGLAGLLASKMAKGGKREVSDRFGHGSLATPSNGAPRTGSSSTRRHSTRKRQRRYLPSSSPLSTWRTGCVRTSTDSRLKERTCCFGRACSTQRWHSSHGST